MAEIEYVTVELLEAKLQNVAAEDDRQNRRISQLEQGLMKWTDIVISIEKMTINVEQIATETKENTEAIKQLQGKGGKIWEKIIDCTISAIVSGLVVYAFCKLGLKG